MCVCVCVCVCVRERERDKIDNTLLHRDKDLSTCQLFFANLSLMTNTATLNTSNKNSLKYAREKNDLKTKQRERERVLLSLDQYNAVSSVTLIMFSN